MSRWLLAGLLCAAAPLAAQDQAPDSLVVYPGAPHGFDGYGVDCGLDPHQYAIDFIRKHPR